MLGEYTFEHAPKMTRSPAAYLGAREERIGVSRWGAARAMVVSSNPGKHALLLSFLTPREISHRRTDEFFSAARSTGQQRRHP
jgi:hypothetical protein